MHNLQSNFSLENFKNLFIKENLTIVWSDYILNEDNNQSTYEFNTYLKKESTLSNGDIQLATKYKLLASKNEPGIYEYELIKFLSINDTLSNTLSYFNPSFSGTLYHYNLNGETVKIKAFKEGKLLSEFSENIKGNAFSKSQSTGVSGYYQKVCTEDYTDWYRVYEGVAYYTHSVKTGESCEYVYVETYNSGFNTSFHNHYDGNHGTNGTRNNHVNEVVVDDNIVVEGPDRPIKNMIEFLKCFDNTKAATLTIYADQPTPNSSVPANYNGDPGHAFVSLNQDGNTAIFGFYPQEKIKSFTLANGAMNNDERHLYDASITINLTAKALTDIINFASTIPSTYNINFFNCTDYVIEISKFTTLKLPDCYSPYYPGGGGSTPSVLGQYIRNLPKSNNYTTTSNTTNSPYRTGKCGF